MPAAEPAGRVRPSRAPGSAAGAGAPGARGHPRGELRGPALIVDRHTTVVLEPGWRARALADGVLLLEEEAAAEPAARLTTTATAARLEIFNNLFMHIAEQMGEVLKSTAQSVNIRERLDYSCALFDAAGDWWRTRRTCRCIWGRWARACAR